MSMTGKETFKKLFVRLMVIQHRISLIGMGVEYSVADEQRFIDLISKTVLIDAKQIEKNKSLHEESTVRAQVTKHSGSDIALFVSNQLARVRRNYSTVISPNRRLLDRNRSVQLYQDFLEVSRTFKDFSFIGKELTIMEIKVHGLNPFSISSKQIQSTVSILYFTNATPSHLNN